MIKLIIGAAALTIFLTFLFLMWINIYLASRPGYGKQEALGRFLARKARSTWRLLFNPYPPYLGRDLSRYRTWLQKVVDRSVSNDELERFEEAGRAEADQRELAWRAGKKF